MIDKILLFLAKKVGHAGGGEHIYIDRYVCVCVFLAVLLYTDIVLALQPVNLFLFY